jgi:hypothetical protein
MCSVTVRFHKDLDMAAVMVTEDYLAKHIRKRPLYAKIPNRPPRPESAFVSPRLHKTITCLLDSFMLRPSYISVY